MPFCDLCGKPLPAAASETCPNCGANLTGELAAPTSPPPTPPPTVRPWALVGRPAGWGSSWTWICSGMGATGRGTVAAIVCAWFGVPVVVLLAGVGAITGAVVGFFSGTPMGAGVVERMNVFFGWIFPLPLDVAELLPAWAWQSGMSIGLIVGAVWGALRLAWLGAVYPWQLLYEGDSMWPFTAALGQVLAAVVLAVLFTVVMIRFERWRLCQFTSAREPSRREAAELGPILAECSARLGQAGTVPGLLVSDRSDFQVKAETRHIVIGRGLLAAAAELDDRAAARALLTAAIGREMVHWRDGHVVTELWLKGAALPLYLIYQLAARLFAPSRDTRARPLMLAFRVLLWPVVATVRWILIPIQGRFWKAAAVAADRAAVAAGWAGPLRDAITAETDSGGPVPNWDAAVASTRPPTEQRLQVLADAGADGDLWDDLKREGAGRDRARD